MADDQDSEFSAYAAARLPALRRSAYLLCAAGGTGAQRGTDPLRLAEPPPAGDGPAHRRAGRGAADPGDHHPQRPAPALTVDQLTAVALDPRLSVRPSH